MSRRAWDLLYRNDRHPWKGGQDVELPLTGTVLELGIGNGKNLSALPRGARVIGLDFSRPALLSCRERTAVQLVQANILALPFRDGCMDGIAASHVLGHLDGEGRRRAASEIARVLAPQGLLYVSVFGEEDMRCGKGKEVEELTYLRGNGIACHYFLEGEVPGLFPTLTLERHWERRLDKRYHGRPEVRQERRYLFRG